MGTIKKTVFVVVAFIRGNRSLGCELLKKQLRDANLVSIYSVELYNMEHFFNVL